MPLIAKNKDLPSKICIYSDTRVSPYGVVSISQRLTELKDGWIKYHKLTEEFYENEIRKSAREIEKQTFAQCNITPEDITEQKIQTLIDDLRNFDIDTH